MTDKFMNYPPALNSPASDAYAITPSDTVNETTAFRAIYVGAAGDVTVVTLDGTAVTFAGAVAGTVIPVRGIRMNDTGTDADDLVGLV